MNFFGQILVFGVLINSISLPHLTYGLDCYACSATSKDSTCEHDPKNVQTGNPVIECIHGEDICCIIQRQETNEKPGEVESLYRGCQVNCSMDNFVSLAGPSFTVYYTYCSQPLCNGELGNQPIGGVNETRSEWPKSTEKNENKYRSSVTMTYPSVLMTFICFLLPWISRAKIKL